jgi:2-polyprenyl-3-methyl-5-hydroxy-6-metoxy-1,4-benzoquinol methylase
VRIAILSSFLASLIRAIMQAPWRSLAVRDLRPEWMDQPDLEPRLHCQALVGLARINAVSGSLRIVWKPIRQLMEDEGLRSLSILDIGSGAGDLTIGLWHKARRCGLEARVVGCDVSRVAIGYARQRADAAHAAVEFLEADVFQADWMEPFDVVLCSLFLHHHSAEAAVALLRRMGELAGRLVVVNDLVRGPLGYSLAWMGTRVLTPSPVVHADGPQSVRAAFTVAEATELAARAGLHGAQIRRRWPCRFLLSWRKAAEVAR